MRAENILKSGLVLILLILNMSFALGAASFFVINSECSPEENAVGDIFSCTVQIYNDGDASGSVNEIRLYPDENEWLENANYLQTSGVTISPGETIEVTFSGLKAVKGGSDMGFSRITLDNVEDTSIESNIAMNVIDALVTVSNSASSVVSGGTFTATPEVTAVGEINPTLTISIDSGSCNIGNQASQKTGDVLSDQQKWIPAAWTITQGSEDCRYIITASATGTNEIASKTSSVSNTVKCSGCASSSGGGSGGASARAGVSGGAQKAPEIIKEESIELGGGESYKFAFGGEEHSLTVLDLTETSATISIKSEEKIITLLVSEETNVDFENDGKDEISVKLKSINVITKKALFVITPLYKPEITGNPEKEEKKGIERTPAEKIELSLKIIAGIIIAALVIIALASYFGWINYKKLIFRKSVKIKKFKSRTKEEYSSNNSLIKK